MDTRGMTEVRDWMGQGENWEKWGGVPVLFSVNTGKLEPSQTEASQMGVEEEDPGANPSG